MEGIRLHRCIKLVLKNKAKSSFPSSTYQTTKELLGPKKNVKKIDDRPLFREGGGRGSHF